MDHQVNQVMENQPKEEKTTDEENIDWDQYVINMKELKIEIREVMPEQFYNILDILDANIDFLEDFVKHHQLVCQENDNLKRENQDLQTERNKLNYILTHSTSNQNSANPRSDTDKEIRNQKLDKFKRDQINHNGYEDSSSELTKRQESAEEEKEKVAEPEKMMNLQDQVQLTNANNAENKNVGISSYTGPITRLRAKKPKLD